MINFDLTVINFTSADVVVNVFSSLGGGVEKLPYKRYGGAWHTFWG